MRDRLHERLIGGERLLVTASVEHDRPRLAGLAGECGGQACLADAGLARRQHEAPLAIRRRGQRSAQLRHRALAADEEAPFRPREDGRERKLPRSRLAGLREHLLVERTQLGGRRGAQLLAQQHAQVLERLERLGLVAARGVRPHQQGMAGLAERRQIHELACGELRAQRPVAAQRERGLGQQLEGLEPLLLLAAPVLLEPGRVEGRHQLGLVDVERGLRCRAGQLRIRPQGRASAFQRRRGLVHVDLRVGGELQPKLRPAPHQLGPERPPQARQQRAQRGRRVARGAARPERVHQLVARDGAVAVQDEVGQQGAPQAPRKPSFDAAAAYLDSQLTAEVDPQRWPQRA